MTRGWTRGGGHSRQRKWQAQRPWCPVKPSEELHHPHRLSQLLSGEGRVIKVALKSSLGLAWPSDADAGHVIGYFLP